MEQQKEFKDMQRYLDVIDIKLSSALPDNLTDEEVIQLHLTRYGFITYGEQIKQLSYAITPAITGKDEEMTKAVSKKISHILQCTEDIDLNFVFSLEKLCRNISVFTNPDTHKDREEMSEKVVKGIFQRFEDHVYQVLAEWVAFEYLSRIVDEEFRKKLAEIK